MFKYTRQVSILIAFCIFLDVGTLKTLSLYDDLPRSDEFLYGDFPSDFKWGVATSAYQIEGAYQADGKGESIWDEFVHREPSPIANDATGDVACDSYNLYKEDVKIAKMLNVSQYRFSISWTRLIPTGKISDGINEKGIAYYNNLINELLNNGIEPMVTLYHWDLPQGLVTDESRGWMDPSVIQHFVDYAELCFDRFGDRVKIWITFNEAWNVCVNGYDIGIFAPNINEPVKGLYDCGHNILIAHSHAYHLYNNEYKPTQHGIIGITIDAYWEEPKDKNNQADVEAAQRKLLFKHGWFFFPIYFGHYPFEMVELVNSKNPNPSVPRMRHFTTEESEKLKGSYDFLGLNHYTTALVSNIDEPEDGFYGWFFDHNTVSESDPDWPTSGSFWLKSVPWGFRKLLNWIKDTYNNPLVFVTENGWSDDERVGLNDHLREEYFRNYTNEMLKAINIDGCNVRGYAAWTLMDNFEWLDGYTTNFGIYYVDFEDANRTRVPKKSAQYIRKIYSENGFTKPE